MKTIKNTRVAHKNWISTLNRAFAFMNVSMRGEIISITGPSRVGKSRLIKDLMNMVSGSSHVDDYGNMPVICIRATNSSRYGSFSTKDFIIRALSVLKHPIYGVPLSDNCAEAKRLKSLETTPEGVLRMALESIIKQRNTRYFFIDEPQHIQYVSNNQKVSGQVLDSWKCLAESTGVTLILVGAYPLLNVFKLCPHMLGRKHQVHFRRYHYNESDLLAFCEILESYSNGLLLPKGVNSLSSWIDELYDGSMGCIGHLEKWLRGSLALVLANDDQTLSLKHLRAARQPKIEEARLIEEITEGEEILGDSDVFDNTILTEAADKKGGCCKVKKTKKTHSFIKNPRRYEIGGRNEENGGGAH